MTNSSISRRNILAGAAIATAAAPLAGSLAVSPAAAKAPMAMSAGGHTPGHTAYSVESGGKRIIVAGDFANQPALSIARPDWHVKFDMDKDAAVATRKKMLDMLAADRVPFTSYHMPFPAVGYIDKTADGGYHYVPVSYQLDV